MAQNTLLTSLKWRPVIIVILLAVSWHAKRTEGAVSFSLQSSWYRGQLLNSCSGAYYIQLTEAESVSAMTFNPPICRAFKSSDVLCKESDAWSPTNTMTYAGGGSSLSFHTVYCTSVGTVTWTVTSTTGSTATRDLYIYDFLAPVSNDAPLVLYENFCTLVPVALDREFWDPTVPSLSVQLVNQGSCSAYKDSTCSTPLNSAAMVTTAGVGTSIPMYVRCLYANADVTTTRTSLKLTFGSQFYINGIVNTPVVAVRDFSWSANAPSLLQYQCSSALVAYTAPYALQAWPLGLRKSNTDCLLYSDAYCANLLEKDVLYVAGASAAVYIRCATTGSLTVTASILSGEVASPVMTISNSPAGCTFDFSNIALSETSRLPSASNTLTMTIRPATSALVTGDTITVNGLASMSTASSASLTLSGAQADIFGSAAEWSQSAGTLVLTVAAGKTVPTSSDTVVSFDLSNPSAFSNSQPYFTTSKMASRVWPAAPLVASGQGGFAVKTVTSSSTAAGQATTITITMRPNRPRTGVETIKITNLVGLTISAGTKLSGAGASLFSYGWDDPTDTLTLMLLFTKVMLSDADTVVSITGTNPYAAQSGTVPSIELGSDPAESCGATILAVADTQYIPSSSLAVAEDNPVPGAANRVTLSFIPSLTSLVANMKLEVLFTPPLDIPTGSTAVNSGAVPIASFGDYDSSTGILTLTVTADISKSTACTVSVDFTNSASKNAGFSVKLRVQGDSAWLLASTFNLGTAAAAFEALEVVESVRSDSTPNALMFRIRPTYDIPFTKVEIGPLSFVSSVSSVVASGMFVVFSNPTKRLSLTGSGMKTLLAGEDYTFTVTVANPSTAQTPVNLYFSSNLVSTPTLFSAFTTQSILQATTSPHGMMTTMVSESNDLPSEPNTLTFTIMPSSIQSSGTLRIRGLVNSGTADTASLAVSGTEAAVFGSVASWTQSTGTLELTIAAGQSLLSTANSVFSVSILNPTSAQNAIAPEISIDGTNYVSLAGFVFAARGGFNVKNWQMQLDPLTPDLCIFTFVFSPSFNIEGGTIVISELAGGTGSVSPSSSPSGFLTASSPYYNTGTGTFTLTVAKIFQPSSTVSVTFKRVFTSKSFSPKIAIGSMGPQDMSMSLAGNIIQALWQDSNIVAGQDNQLAFYLRPYTDMSTGSTIHIKGLTNSGTASSASLALTGAQAAVFGSAAVWDQSAGTLLLTVATGQTWAAAAESEVLVTLGNPAAAADLFTSLEASMDGTNWLAMTRYGFSERTIQKLSSPSASSSNPGTMIFTLKPYTLLPKTAIITISGLNCIAPSDSPVIIYDSPEMFDTNGVWDNAASSLTLTVSATNGMLTTQSYLLQLKFTDVDQTCEPKVSLLSRHPVPITNAFFNLAPSSFAAPMSKALVSQSSTTPGDPNTLTFTIRPLFELAAGSAILIDSLYHSTTVSSSALTVSGADAALFGSVAKWTQDTSSLLLTIATSQTLSNAQDAVISVTLTNPGSMMVPGVPRVWSNYQAPVPADKGVLGGSLSANDYCGACGPHCDVCANALTCMVCASTYTLNNGMCTICGDGMRSGGEACDDGNTANGDGCSSTCTVQTGYECVGGSPSSADTCSLLIVSVCGDGKRNAGESCDDGNAANGDGCSSTCTVESGYSCTGGSSTTADTCTVSGVCGNSKRTGGEACDDGNTANGDGCSSTCTVESGYSCTGGSSTTADTCTVSGVCGNSKRTGGEACDDGNTANGDGCSSTCTVESGYSCTGGSSTTADTCTLATSAAPVFLTSSVSSITLTSFVFSMQLNVPSTVYYVLDTQTSATPSIANIKNLKNAAGSNPLRSAKILYDVSLGQVDKFVLLSPSTVAVTYNLFVYAVNKASGVGQSSVTKLTVAVGAPPSKSVSSPISSNSTVNTPATVSLTLTGPVTSGSLTVSMQLAGPQSTTATVTPSSVMFSGSTVSNSFTVTGAVDGVAFIIYTLSGTAASQYAPPSQTLCSFGPAIVIKPLVSGQTSMELQATGPSANHTTSEQTQIRFDPSSVPDITSLRLQYITFSSQADNKSTADGETMQNPINTHQNNLDFAGTSFSLSAYSGTDLRESTLLDTPLLINTSYTYLNAINASTAEKQTAVLKYYDTLTETWLVASESCPEAQRFSDNIISSTMLSVNVCHLTQFAIFYTASGKPTPADVALIVGLCFACAGTVALFAFVFRFYYRRRAAKGKSLAAHYKAKSVDVTRTTSAPIVLPVPMSVSGQSFYVHPAGCNCPGCIAAPVNVAVPLFIPTAVPLASSEYISVEPVLVPTVPIAVPIDFFSTSEAKKLEESAPLTYREIVLSVETVPEPPVDSSSPFSDIRTQGDITALN